MKKTRAHGYNEPIKSREGGGGVPCIIPEVLLVASKGKPNTG